MHAVYEITDWSAIEALAEYPEIEAMAAACAVQCAAGLNTFAYEDERIRMEAAYGDVHRYGEVA